MATLAFLLGFAQIAAGIYYIVQGNIVAASFLIADGFVWIILGRLLDGQAKIIAKLEDSASAVPEITYAKQFAPQLITRHLAQNHPTLPREKMHIDRVEPYIDGGILAVARIQNGTAHVATYNCILTYKGEPSVGTNWKVKIVGKD